MRALAELYKVSVDELLDLDATSIDIAGAEQAEENETPAANTAAMPIGFCKGCGIAVTEENLGTSDPVILCKKCLNAKNEEKKRIEQQKKQAEAKRIYEEKARREENARKLKRGMIWHFIVAALAAGLFLSAMIGVLAEEFSVGMLVGALIGTGIVFCLVFCLFYECWVNDVVFEWTSKAFQAPGLIFTFDLDGCLWLIGMKLLFWAIGVLFSLACGAIGIAIASVISPSCASEDSDRLDECCSRSIDSCRDCGRCVEVVVRLCRDVDDCNTLELRNLVWHRDKVTSPRGRIMPGLC